MQFCYLFRVNLCALSFRSGNACLPENNQGSLFSMGVCTVKETHIKVVSRDLVPPHPPPPPPRNQGMVHKSLLYDRVLCFVLITCTLLHFHTVQLWI